MQTIRGVLGLVVGVVARLWLATLRVDVDINPALDAVRERPWVLAFFHGTQWPLLAWRRRRSTLVMVSLSLDGALQARALSVLGFAVVRGSSSRGGMRALARIVRRLRAEVVDAAFAVDGPRGPRGVAKGGAALAARAAGGVLVPMGAAFARGFVLRRAWDRFAMAWPWSRVVVRLGAPLDPAACRGDLSEALGAAIASANDRALGRLGSAMRRPRAPAAEAGAPRWSGSASR